MSFELIDKFFVNYFCFCLLRQLWIIFEFLSFFVKILFLFLCFFLFELFVGFWLIGGRKLDLRIFFVRLLNVLIFLRERFLRVYLSCLLLCFFCCFKVFCLMFWSLFCSFCFLKLFFFVVLLVILFVNDCFFFKKFIFIFID